MHHSNIIIIIAIKICNVSDFCRHFVAVNQMVGLHELEQGLISTTVILRTVAISHFTRCY